MLANIYIGDASILIHFVEFLDPFARALGLDGFILMAFIIGLPANEIVPLILLMGYLATGSLTEVTDMFALKQIFLDQGWTWLTALNMMLFSAASLSMRYHARQHLEGNEKREVDVPVLCHPDGHRHRRHLPGHQVARALGWV